MKTYEETLNDHNRRILTRNIAGINMRIAALSLLAVMMISILIYSIIVNLIIVTVLTVLSIPAFISSSRGQFRRLSAFKKDLRGNIKKVFKGTIAKKNTEFIYKRGYRFLLTIDSTVFEIKKADYELYTTGDHIKIEIGPHSKILVGITK